MDGAAQFAETLIEDSPPAGQGQPDAFRTFETPGGDEKCEDEESGEEEEEAGNGHGDGATDGLYAIDCAVVVEIDLGLASLETVEDRKLDREIDCV